MTKVQLSPLELLYEDAKDIVEDESEALKRNITSIFWQDMESKLIHKELITLLIRGIVRKGKSTGGLAIQHEINRLITKIYRNHKINELQEHLKLIFSDQIEWTEFVTKTDMKQVCVLCDEYSKMGEGSYNATTETQLFSAYLEMFAVNYIHTIFITPSHNFNEHASIILDVIAKDEEKKVTHFKLLYKNKLENRTLCLGRIEVDVSNIINKGYYKNYLTKKTARLDLLNKHGIRDIRDTIFAKLALETYERLKPLAKTSKLPAEIVNIMFQKVARENKAILSIISETSITNKVRGFLNMEVIINKTKQEVVELRQKDDQKKLNSKTHELRIMEETFGQLINEMETLKNVYYKYKNIGDTVE